MYGHDGGGPCDKSDDGQIIQDEKIWYEGKLRKFRNVLDLKKIMCPLLLGIMLISIGCSKTESVMSKACVMTIPRCAKYSEEKAAATCENTDGISSGYIFGFGLDIHRSNYLTLFETRL